jgi:hypothetical protein
LERVIDLKDQQLRMWGLLQVEDAILLVAAGDVTAGIDLSKMRDGDMQVKPQTRSVLLRLPPPEIFAVTLDTERTYVHSRKTSVLAQPVLDMEQRARMHAEKSIRNAALEAGILERARDNAERTLIAFIRSLGYVQVELNWQEQ